MRRSHVQMLVTALAMLFLATSAGSARAQSAYVIPWFTMDAGGGVSISADLEIQGTIAQSDAQGTLAAGNYELTGGFWNPGAEVSCLADYNNDGRVSVQDIFDFLGAWFGGCFAQGGTPCFGHTADINGSGTISVQDIFDFLAAWFGGCPGY